jgi:hypothetical protein
MEKNQTFIIHGTNDKLWNFQELIGYLVKNQHQHISLKINPEAICLETLGIYRLLDNFKFKQVDIYTENQLEKHDRYNIIINSDNYWLSHIPLIATDLHQWSGAKTFLAFYHRPTASRLGIASYLHTHYQTKSHIHFPFKTDINNLELFEFDKLGLYLKESLMDATHLLADMPLKVVENINLDSITTLFDYFYDSDTTISMYKDIFVDLVGENHVAGNTFYPTEKIARSMWLKKPFIVFGSRDYLCYLRQMGFKTFQTPTLDFWSEEYDSYEGRERYIRMLALIDELAKKSKEELQELYQAMQPILEHNYNLLKTQSYNTIITQID